MIDVDFIEIGTSDFGTLIENAKEDEIGFSVEPIKSYLSNLPNKPNVKKVNCAISFDNNNGFVEVYYVKNSIIESENLPWWLKGCNSINNYHPQHVRLKIEHLVTREKVPCMSIENFLTSNNIRGIKYLKLDTEGGDCFILKHLARYLNNKKEEYYPKQIVFESNTLTDETLVNNTIAMYERIGYKLKRRTRSDTTLIRETK